MMGYAETPADLARGRRVRRAAHRRPGPAYARGVVRDRRPGERFAKVFGLRIDLDHVERTLAAQGIHALAADGGAASSSGVDVVGEAGRREAGPGGAAGARPRAGRGHGRDGERPAAARVGQAGLRRTRHDGRLDPARGASRPGTRGVSTRHEGRLGAVRGGARARGRRHGLVRLARRRLAVLRRDVAAARAAARAAAGRVAPDGRWRELATGSVRPARGATGSTRHRRARGTVETNVLLRAAAIFLIVGSHSNLFMFTGGAHLLLGVVGFNFARFQLTDRPRRERRPQPAHEHHPHRRAERAVAGVRRADLVEVRPAQRPPPQRRPRLPRLDRVVALLVHRGTGLDAGRADAAGRRAGLRPGRAALAVLAPGRPGDRRAAHPLRRRPSSSTATTSTAPT